jgi:hypothetical protein
LELRLDSTVGDLGASMVFPWFFVNRVFGTLGPASLLIRRVNRVFGKDNLGRKKMRKENRRSMVNRASSEFVLATVTDFLALERIPNEPM